MIHCATSLARAPHLMPFALLVLMAGLTGCFSARSTRPLTHSSPSISPVPILPVLPGEVRITVDDAGADLPGDLAVAEIPSKSRDDLALLLNEVLDDLAKGEDLFIGPSRLRGTPANHALKRLNVYLDDPDPLDEAWKAQGLAEIGREIDATGVVRVRARLHFSRDTLCEVADTMAADWKGKVTVNVQLIGLDPPALLAGRVSEDRFWGEVGVAAVGGYPYAVVFPYGFGRSVGNSLEVATRQALTDLLSAMEETR